MRYFGCQTWVRLGLMLTVTCFFSAIGSAADHAATPELEAKTERILSQRAQQPTQEQREAAAAALKAQKERIKKAKEAQSQPASVEKGPK